MKRIFLSVRDIEFFRHVLPALIFAASLGFFVHGYWLIDLFPVGSKSLLFFTLLTSLAGMAGYTLLFRWMTRAFHGLSNLQKASIVGAGLLAGSFLFFTLTGNWQKPSRYISLFLPTHTLEVSIPPGQDTGQVSILWINTSLGDVSHAAIEYDGWEIKKDQLILTDTSNNQLRWAGKTGDEVQIIFESSTQTGKALLSWDGQEETLSLNKKKNTYLHTFDVPFYASQSWALFLGILNFALLSLPLCIIIWGRRTELYQSIQREFTPTSQQTNKREWIAVVALMALVFVLRAPNLEILFPSVEEYSHINAAKQIIQGAPIGSVYERSLWLVTLPVSLMFRIFGYKLWAARLLGVVVNTLAVIPLYLITRRMNRSVAILSILLFATSPWIIAMSRVVREYAYYPFYFFWIIYGMILLLEEIPNQFHIDRDWKIVLKPKVLFLVLSFALPLVYVIRVDQLSTFQLILIAYAVLVLFIFLKMDFRYRKNLPVVLMLIGVALVGMYLWSSRFDASGTLNLIPLNYFFMNSPQQWYFERAAIIPLLGLLGVAAASVLIWRTNIIPLFVLTLYGSFLAFFIVFMKRFFAPRHLSTAELWYVILMAIGLYLIWLFLQTYPSLRGKWSQTLIVIALAGAVINVQQVFVPLTSHDPAMPITEDYHNDLTDLQSYMLANVKPGDVLISSRIYSRYVEWVGTPTFREIYDFQVKSTEADVLSFVDQYDSGWIIIDNARIERAVFSPGAVFLDNDRIEYIGLFDDEHVWRWRVK